MTRLKDLLDSRPPPFHAQRSLGRAEYVLADPRLIEAAEVSLLLGQPLVLAGEPGVGKTQFAYKLADDTDLYMHPEINVSTTTEGRSLLYTFDEVKRFHAGAENGADQALVSFVRFTGFGRAILWAAGPDAQVTVNPALTPEEVSGVAPVAEGTYRLGDIFAEEFRHPDGGRITRPTPTIVLLDEFDKAPRDAPNDLLRAVERMRFTIEELGMEIGVSAAHAKAAWPVVVMTSNSERSLPDAFLRRCVFHWIGFPDRDSGILEQIVASHCRAYMDLSSGEADPPEPEEWEEGDFVRSVVQMLYDMRQRTVNKKPATGELLAFVSALLSDGYHPYRQVKLADPAVRRAVGALLKTREDLENFNLAR